MFGFGMVPPKEVAQAALRKPEVVEKYYWKNDRWNLIEDEERHIHNGATYSLWSHQDTVLFQITTIKGGVECFAALNFPTGRYFAKREHLIKVLSPNEEMYYIILPRHILSDHQAQQLVKFLEKGDNDTTLFEDKKSC
jgi:hypothetical protein